MKLTIILPTYNNDKTINECLKSIYSQDYPKKDYEVLLIDGGSTDKTLKIAKKYPVRIINNPKRVEEVARITGIRRARGGVLGFVDADNVLVGKDWISRMIKPFDEDKEISFADTLYYSYRKKDKMVVRYQALIGGDDPIAMYLGMYSRWNYITNKWTGYPHRDYEKKDYIKSEFTDKKMIPPMGSNGFLIRKNILRNYFNNKFIHSDIIYNLVNNGYNIFAKVNIGIIHDQRKFFTNKIRRLKRRMNHEVEIKNQHYGLSRTYMIIKALYIMMIIPLIIDSIRGFIHKPDRAWSFHPIASVGVMIIYTYYSIAQKIKDLIRR